MPLTRIFESGKRSHLCKGAEQVPRYVSRLCLNGARSCLQEPYPSPTYIGTFVLTPQSGTNDHHDDNEGSLARSSSCISRAESGVVSMPSRRPMLAHRF